MTKIKKPAIRESSGKVVEAKGRGNHDSIGLTGQRGFTTTGGKFVNRTQGAKIAKSSGQSVAGTGKRLHSEDLKSHQRKK